MLPRPTDGTQDRQIRLGLPTKGLALDPPKDRGRGICISASVMSWLDLPERKHSLRTSVFFLFSLARHKNNLCQLNSPRAFQFYRFFSESFQNSEIFPGNLPKFRKQRILNATFLLLDSLINFNQQGIYFQSGT